MTTFTNSPVPSRKTFCIAALVLALCFGSGSLARADGVKPNLHVVAAGVSQYPRLPLNMQLRCAHKDAVDATNLLQAQEGKMFGKVTSSLMTDAQATGNNILVALRQANVQSTPDSYTIVYLAGHGGKGMSPEYAFCAQDRDVRWSEIRQALAGARGTVIVVLDTCQAASATPDDNLIVFCGSLAHETGGEDNFSMGNGYFTKMFLRGLSGAADANGDGIVTLEEAAQYANASLAQFSGGNQHSQLLRPGHISGTLPLAQVAPVVPATLPVVPVTGSGPLVPAGF